LAVGELWQVSLLHAVTVLIITCPCALGLAVPVVQVLASGKLLKNGVLLKSGDALERLATVDTIVFDKTGTLTVGTPILESDAHTEDDMQLAASLAVHSRHPLSKAIAAAYDGELLSLSIQEFPGKGLSADYQGMQIQLGSQAWCGPEGQQPDKTSALTLWLKVGGQRTIGFKFSDQLRTDAKQVVTRLNQMGIATHLLSGDRQVVADAVGNELSIKHIVAGVSPTEKTVYLNNLKHQGHRVLMVGDGLNDAPALSAATASMSPSSAVDITQNAADIVFQGELLAPVLSTLVTARRSTALVRQNFALAILYNIVAIPLAVLGFVTPMLAAAAMSGSSLMVIANAFRIRMKGQ
jgi:Cu2+-exporting ATPase